MPEYFIRANSFAAPFFSDTDHKHVIADDVGTALKGFAENYEHPCGLFAAEAYVSADAMYKGDGPLMRWLSNSAAGRKGEPKEGQLEPVLRSK